MKKHWSKKAKFTLLIPSITIGVGGGTYGGLAIAGYVFHVGPLAHNAINVNEIFGIGFAWNANNYEGPGSSEANALNDNPNIDVMNARIMTWLTENDKTQYFNVVNDLIYGAPVISGSTYTITVTTSGSSYSGSFTITSIYIDTSTHNLNTDVSNKIVDDTSVLGTTVGAVLQKLKDNNTNLNLNAVAISTAGFVDPSATISRDTASSLWTEYDSTNHYYAYQFTLSGLDNSQYTGQSILINVKLQRTAYPLESAVTFARHFYEVPNLEQVKDTFDSAYSAQSWYTNFMSVSTNLSWGTISTSCTLTYGDANQYYLSGSTSFTLNIDNPTAISELFLSDDKSLNIVNDTIATPLVFYTDPSSADLSNAYQDVYVLLTNRYVGNYGSETWINFNSLDFTSMYATGVNASAGTSGNKGTITISALSGSTIYSGSLNITWQSWNYIPV